MFHISFCSRPNFHSQINFLSNKILFYLLHRDLKCKDSSLSLKDYTGGNELEVKPADNTSYAELSSRTQDCELTMIGKPVFHNYLDIKYGAWLRDPVQKDNVTVEKIWMTKESEPMLLYEYKNKNDHRKDIRSRQPYKLPCPFKVNIHSSTLFGWSCKSNVYNFSGQRSHRLQRFLLLLLCWRVKNYPLRSKIRKKSW